VRSLFEPDVLQEPVFDRRAEQLTIDEFAALTWKMPERPEGARPKDKH
jgi:16S rRNA (adenine1518-N6/adenine1519-N6)-dimethyltransferase